MALSADRQRDFQDGQLISLPMAASVTIYNGSIVVQDAAGGAHTTGYAFAATLSANNRVVGVATERKVDSTASDGGTRVNVRRNCPVWLTNSSTGNALTAALIGTTCYIEDDEKVRKYVAGGVNVPIGQMLAIGPDSDGFHTGEVLIQVDGRAYVECAPGDFTVVGDLTVSGGNVNLTGATVVATTTGDLTLDSPDDDVIVELGDAAGAKKFIVLDSADAQVFAVDSNGEVEMVAGQAITGAGALTMTATGAALQLTGGTTAQLTATAGQATVIAGTQVNITSQGASDVVLTTAANCVVSLPDAAGASHLYVDDSIGAHVFDVDSNGNVAMPAGTAVTGAGALTVASTGAALTLTGGTTIVANSTTTTTITAGTVLNLASTGANDINITGGAGANVDVQLGDAAGANYFRIYDNVPAQVFSVDSNGAVALVNGSTITSAGTLAIATTGAALTLTGGTTIEVNPAQALNMTSGAGFDINLTGAAGSNVDIQLGDNGGVNLLRVYDSTPAIIMQVDSNGNVQHDGTLTSDGLATFNAGIAITTGFNIQLGAASDILGGAGDLDITAGANQNVDIQLGDNGGVNYLRIYDSAPALRASINSDGMIAVVAGLGSGVITNYAATDAGGANPTIAALAAAFGAAGAAMNGFVGVYHNTNGAGGCHVVFVADGAWYYHAAAVAA